MGEAEGDIAGDSPAAGVVVSPPPQAVKLAATPKAKSKPIAFLFIEFLLVNCNQRQSLVVKSHWTDEKASLLYSQRPLSTITAQLLQKAKQIDNLDSNGLLLGRLLSSDR